MEDTERERERVVWVGLLGLREGLWLGVCVAVYEGVALWVRPGDALALRLALGRVAEREREPE